MTKITKILKTTLLIKALIKNNNLIKFNLILDEMFNRLLNNILIIKVKNH